MLVEASNRIFHAADSDCVRQRKASAQGEWQPRQLFNHPILEVRVNKRKCGCWNASLYCSRVG